MANEQNLKPIQQSNEEATKNGRKGGIASGKVRREKRTFRELAETLGAMLANEHTRKNVKKILPMLKDDEISYDVAIVVNNIMRASNGDARASEWLSKIKGESVVRAEITGKDGQDLIPRTLSEEEMRAMWNKMEEEC